MDTFKINTAEEARKFEELTKKYLEYYLNPPLHFNFQLDKIFSDCQEVEDGGRIFTASFDLYVTLHLTVQDVYSVAGSWNKYFSDSSQIASKEDDIFENPNAFMGRMLLHRHLTTFITRYRALWEKLLGIYFLIYQISHYEYFTGSKSKLKYFNNNFLPKENIDSEVLEYISTDLVDFDRKYRTAEIHGAGKVRKWTFKQMTESFSTENPVREIAEYHWQRFINLAGRILMVFDDIPKN